MNRLLLLGFSLLFFGILPNAVANVTPSKGTRFDNDTIPLRDRQGDYLRDSVVNPFNLRDPGIITKKVEYDPTTNRYYITEKIGDDYYRAPTALTFDEYSKWKAKQQEKEYFERLAGLSKKRGGETIDPLSKIDFSASQNSKMKMLLKSVGVNGKLPEVPKLDIKKIGDNLIGMIFGDPPTVDIRPQGQIDLTIGGDYRNFKNPILPIYAQRSGGLLFNMDIQMNVTGKIGEKLNLNTSFNNKAAFDFDNIMKLNYNSNVFSEDDIIKSIEGGNVNLPLRGTLIQGSQNLFGIKTELQFGYLRLTALAAQQRNRRQNINVQGGSQTQTFNVPIDQYDENRHFFLSHFNRNTFEDACKTLPLINSLFSITKIEVWVSNERNEDKEVRQIIAMSDLAEGELKNIGNKSVRLTSGSATDITGKIVLPDNKSNELYKKILDDSVRTRRIDRVINTLESTNYGLAQGRDFVKRAAKRLQPSEYSYNPKLGTISINNVERQQVVGVSYIYYYNGKGPFQVGEFADNVAASSGSDSVAQVLYVKMLKNTVQLPAIPLFDLMMRNVYSVGAYVTNPQDLQLDIIYQDASVEKAEKRSLRELPKVPLLSLLNLDRLNQVGDPQPDGQFDFIPEVTINTRNGRIMFPVLEPFGSSLKNKLDDITKDPTIASKYIFQELYDSTLFRAQERQEKNRFFIRGRVKSSSSNRIQLNAFGLRPGAVSVTAGAFQLLEGVDFAIDYGTSVLTVLNPAYVAPNIPLNVSYEDNAFFGLQTRTMLGLRADYQVKKNFNVGATVMNLFEQPFTRKVNFGDDPINNKVYGLDLNFTEDAPWLTKLVDKIPFISTKEPSKITFSAETALLKPGHSKAINVGNDKGGAVYLDDFEGSSSPFSLMAQPAAWALASTPQKNPLWRESTADSLLPGINRALLNWYRIDQFVSGRSGAITDIYSSPVPQTEVFPNRTNGGSFNVVGPENFSLATLDLTYYPKLRGPYNFDVPAGTVFSKGLGAGPALRSPETRWAGIMRGMTTTDFEAANIEYLDIWLLDPLLKPENRENSGTLLFHLGDVSEDILRDSRKFYENGLPTTVNPDFKTDNTRWGRVPRTEIPLPNSFSADESERKQQDIGLDGLDDVAEKNFFADYLNKVRPLAGFDVIEKDPSADDFKYYNDYPENTDIYERYKLFNGPEGNSATNSGSQGVQSGTNLPDAEDVNRDNSFEENEAYFEYRIPFVADPTGVGIDTRNLKYHVEYLDDKPTGRRWHHFRVPIDGYDKKYGEINDFRSIRFMRTIVKDFKEKVTLRFAKMDLIRNQWRRYKPDRNTQGFDLGNSSDQNFMELNAVNIEENSKKEPFNYVLPPGILRELIPGSIAANARQNEQSLSMRLVGLPAKKSRAAFKLFSMDMRIYERLKMFVHAETTEGVNLDGKLCVFMRLGSDYERNYYEIEMPLTFSDKGRAGTPPTASQTGSSVAIENPYINEVWHKDNRFDVLLNLLIKAKTERNVKNISLSEVYTAGVSDPEHPNMKIKVRGNPDIGFVRGVMVGVNNKDDVPHDIELWINEMRATGLNENSGAAAIARTDFKLADFGNVSVSGNYLGIGYGAIDQRVTQRSREEVKELNVSGNFELGKFLPVNAGVRIPFTAQYANNIRTPEYDPYDLDVKLKDRLASETDGEKRKSIKDNAETVQVIKGYSFNNVRKDRTGTGTGKPMPWDIENFSVSYGYTELERRDPLVESDAKQNYKGSLDYTYSLEPIYVSPFKNVIKNEKVLKYTKLFSEFNFNPVPNTFGFNTILDRQRNVTKYRFSGDDEAYNTFFQRRFGWDRNYNLQWDLTRALKLNFDAKNFSIVDELPDYNIDNGILTPEDQKQAYLRENLKNFGRTKRYDQNVNVNYTVPFRQIPYMDWVNVKATYSAAYGWEAFSLNPNNDLDNFRNIGNYINNKQTRQVSADLNFDNLYNYSKYLRKIQTARVTQENTRGKKKKKEDPSVTDAPKLPEPAPTVADTTKGKKKKKKEGEYEPSLAERIIIRPLLTFRKARLSINEGYNSYVPGFMPQSSLLGMQDLSAPGWEYTLGWQQADDDWLENARRQNWISRDIRQTKPLLNNYTQSIDARVTLEPFQDFRVEVDLTKNFTRNRSQEYRNPSTANTIDSIRSLNRFDDGSYTISYFTLNTMFKNLDAVFDEFNNNRPIVSNLLNPNGAAHPEFNANNSPRGYRIGYGPTSQEVLVPAFIAAYTGRDVRTTNRDLFKERPSFNWRLTYNGLAKLPFLREKFSNINITHGYKSTMTVNSFRTEPFYDFAKPQTERVESKYEYYPQYDIPTLVISEQFTPLFGIDVSMKNGANFGVSYRKARNLALSVSDTRLQETKTSDITVKFGHRVKNVYIKFLDFNLEKKAKTKKTAEEKKKEAEDKKNEVVDSQAPNADPNAPVTPKVKKKKEPKPKKGNDLVLNFDLSFRDDITKNNLLGQGVEVPSRGSKTLRLAPSATYTINKTLDLRFYIDYNKILPYTSASFPSTNASGGFVITYKLN
jgi:cell surface protein SprA